jgi:hypothetical protein
VGSVSWLYLCQNSGIFASRVAQWFKALHRSASCSTRDSGFEPRLCRNREVHWPSVVRFREGLAGRDILVSSCTSDYCGGPHAVHADQFAMCTVFPPTHWLPGWMRAVLRSSAAWLCFGGRMTRPSSLPSPYGSCSNETRQ